MKPYLTPELIIILLETRNILTASTWNPDDDDEELPPVHKP